MSNLNKIFHRNKYNTILFLLFGGFCKTQMFIYFYSVRRRVNGYLFIIRIGYNVGYDSVK